MKKDYKKQFVSLLRLLEEQRKESSSNTFAFDFPDDLQGIEIKNHDDLSEFSKYISTWYSDYSISAYLEYNDIPSLHDSDGIEINQIGRASCRERV